MKKTYIDYICHYLKHQEPGQPIYVHQLSDKLADDFKLPHRKAAAATAVAVKRIIDGNLMPDLRFYQKGIYYRTTVTAFGEQPINKEQLIRDKYILPDKGYETGPMLLYRMGLSTQIPNEQIIATNQATQCMRTDKKLNVIIKPPKTTINTANKEYLQTLDALELLNKTPLTHEHPYEVLAKHIDTHHLQYDKLLALAERYYPQQTIIQLARTASKGGYIL